MVTGEVTGGVTDQGQLGTTFTLDGTNKGKRRQTSESLLSPVQPEQVVRVSRHGAIETLTRSFWTVVVNT